MNLFFKLKQYQRKNPRKLFETFMTLAVVSLITMGAVFDSGLKEVTVVRINNFENTTESFTTKTRQENIGGLLEEKGITIAEDEITSFELTDNLSDGQRLYIKKTAPVTITVDGETKTVYTSYKKVCDILFEAGVQINPYDWCYPPFEKYVEAGDNIRLQRIDVAEETVTEEFSGPEESRTHDNMLIGDKKVVWGVPGTKNVTYRVQYKDGVEVSREKLSETVTKEAVPTIVYTGTNPRPTATKQGKTFTYTRKLTARATAYDTSLEENGGWTKTAYGLTPGFGIVAVDPRVIPLGTKLYIESPDDGASWTYGYCIAGDVGGAIKGDRIDLCYNTQAECVRFGRRNATVYVIEE